VVDTGPVAPLRQVRYAKFSGTSGWILCLRAEVKGEALVIVDPDGDTETWVPLHYIRGPIEYRAVVAGGDANG
jgi:hypothetical protein